MKCTWTLDELDNAVKISYSWAGTLKSMGLVVSGGSVKALKKHIEKYGINTDHFLGLRWSAGRKLPERNKDISLEKILVENSPYRNKIVKQKLLTMGIKQYVCEICHISEWCSKQLSLELDHINGINNDNRLENLRILCPNCHSQTPTYKGKNIKRKSKVPNRRTKLFCKTCLKNEVTRKNANCISCHKNITSPENFPLTKDEILTELESISIRALARKLGVSDTTIHNKLKKFNLS